MLEPVPMFTLKTLRASQRATLALTPVPRFKSGNSPDTVRVAEHRRRLCRGEQFADGLAFDHDLIALSLKQMLFHCSFQS